MIVLTVLFSVIIPSNAKDILISIMEYVNLDIFETENIFNFVFDFPPTAAFNQIFETAGY